MDSDRKKMISTLNKIVVPILKKKGFKGTFPHYRRIYKNKVDLLVFQFDKWGGGFVVEISKCSKNGGNIFGINNPINFEKITVFNTADRYRLKETPIQEDFWFKYDNSKSADRFEKLAKKIIPMLESQAEKWWGK